MNGNDVRVLIVDLPTTVNGFVYQDSTYNFVIVLNARMPFEIQQKTYRHEMKHIRCGDIDNMNYKEYSA